MRNNGEEVLEIKYLNISLSSRLEQLKGKYENIIG